MPGIELTLSTRLTKGAFVSTVKFMAVEKADTLPAASSAWALTVCTPSAKFSVVFILIAVEPDTEAVGTVAPST